MHRFALLFSALAFLAAALITERIFEGMPHIEDEIAYVWQAKALARGHLTIPSPPHEKSFLVPFVVDHNGQRFGKYPPGWPAVLALGVLLGARPLVNPLLAGAAVWLTYLLGSRLLGERVGLLAAGLTLTSPFFLMNSATLLSHPLGLVLSAIFALSWLEAFTGWPSNRRWFFTLTAALALGVLFLTRPWTALGLGLPFSLHGIYLLWRGEWEVRRRFLVVCLVLLAAVLAYLGWQYALTGDPFLNPYILWWPYDKVGFGPGIGVTAEGHSLTQGLINTRQSLWNGSSDIFGWGYFSWIFLPFGVWVVWRDARALLVASVFPCLVLVYIAYWIGSFLFGPRYYYEGLYSLAIISAAGIAFLAGWPITPAQPVKHVTENPGHLVAEQPAGQPSTPWRVIQQITSLRKARPWLALGVLGLLVSYNLLLYTPDRLGEIHGLYDIRRDRLQPFLTAEARELTPALVIVHPERWMPYGNLLELQDPFLSTPFIFAYSRGSQEDAALASSFPERAAIHYYPDEPYIFYVVK